VPRGRPNHSLVRAAGAAAQLKRRCAQGLELLMSHRKRTEEAMLSNLSLVFLLLVAFVTWRVGGPLSRQWRS